MVVMVWMGQRDSRAQLAPKVFQVPPASRVVPVPPEAKESQDSQESRELVEMQDFPGHRGNQVLQVFLDQMADQGLMEMLARQAFRAFPASQD
jgi:hypothetical protein